MAPVAPPEPRALEVRHFGPEDEEAYVEHFREHGFVVVKSVLEEAEVEASIREVWQSPSLLGGQGPRGGGSQHLGCLARRLPELLGSNRSMCRNADLEEPGEPQGEPSL
ncbi:unnamed protein product [Effrenium voratum]|nr:unnamed protein product [Effrenium voratum]